MMSSHVVYFYLVTKQGDISSQPLVWSYIASISLDLVLTNITEIYPVASLASRQSSQPRTRDLQGVWAFIGLVYQRAEGLVNVALPHGSVIVYENANRMPAAAGTSNNVTINEAGLPIFMPKDEAGQLRVSSNLQRKRL
ncbi:hypothetical protein C0989_004161 [Termitomyces sp. Mn162]|nr:hypothetical protein C0989_004161 [Termitomyces sp. Mn162]